MNHIVMYRPKRSKYLSYKGADYSRNSLKNYVDDILGGSGDFTKVEGNDLAFNEAIKNDEL
jgi:hypothetical protein